jgi:hypothetical protein
MVSASHPTATLRARLISRPNTIRTKSSRRPLLHAISRGQSISILTNPARTWALSVPPTIHEEVTPSPLSTIYRPSSPTPVSPRAYNFLPSVRQSRSPPQNRRSPWRGRNARITRAPPRILRASFSIQQEHVRFHPTKVYTGRHLRLCTSPSSVIRRKKNARRTGPKSILINPGRTRSFSSISQSRSPPHITILSNPEKGKREAHRVPPRVLKSPTPPPH